MKQTLVIGNGPIGEAVVKQLKQTTQGIQYIDNDNVNTLKDKIKAIGEHKGINALVNATEFYQTCPFSQLNLEIYQKALTYRLGSLVIATQAAVPFIEASGGGRIVNLAGARGQLATGEHAMEASIAAAIVAMTREMAVDLQEKIISVNAVSPWLLSEKEKKTFSKAAQKRFMDTTLMNRLITPKDVAIMVEFLLNEDAFTVDAFDLVVDGGMIAFRVRMEESWFDNAEYYH